MTLAPGLFEGKSAVVTGGTSGIGAATAQLMAQLGAQVLALGLDARSARVPCHARVRCVEIDLRDRESASDCLNALPALDMLVNAAGISLERDEYDGTHFDTVMAVNLSATMHVCTRALPALAQRAGAVVNIASMFSTFGSADRPAYAASKGAVVQLTKSLAQTYAPVGVRVNAVAPGFIRTPLAAPLLADEPLARRILERTPLARWGEAAEVAGVIAFLCSPAASFMTGAVVPVDGGYHTT